MELLRRVREDFGIPLIGVRPTGLGADARATLWQGETADGTRYAVKTSAAPQPGLLVADFLASRGVPGVPGPVRTVDGSLTSPLADGGVVSVVPWVDGGRAIETGLDAAQWRGFGELLGEVHATPPDGPLLSGPQALPVDRPDPRDEVRRAREFGDRLSTAAQLAPDDVVLGDLGELWDLHRERVLAVAALAATTGGATADSWSAAEPVICHADPHHGNLLLGAPTDPGGGRRVWLVDWDDAVLAPREADLIFVVGGVYSFAPITTAEVAAFFAGYTPASGGVGLADLDRTRLTHYRSRRALTDFLDFADQVLELERAPVERKDALRIAAGAVSPEGLVTITLSEAAAGH